MDNPTSILVVDDNSANRLILARSLERAGYEVLCAESGAEAISLVEAHCPELILLDIMMPERDGLEVCTELKAREETASIPVIFVTAVTEGEQILRAFSVGGCDYVTKPFRAEEVLARVSVHVRLRRAEEELRGRNDQMERLTRQLAESNVDLAKLSRGDPLTKLFNRRTWEETVDEQHERFRRYSTPYSLIMIDVDGFKAFNDSQGHQAGDECLRRIAESINAACRRVDVAGRYGGEEFVVLAPDTDREAAIKLAERIRKTIWDLGIPHPTSPNATRVTASLGVSTSVAGSWEDVLRRADDAMYVAKRAGRNMVYSDQDSPTSMTATTDSNTSQECPDAQESPGAGESTQHKAHVLVVDDEKTNRLLCRRCLERDDYLVQEAVDGRQALSAIHETPPDVIIMDVMMPEMDGLECTQKLKTDPGTRDIPVIMVSALDTSDSILAGLEAGADEYLTKPISTAELTLRVRSMISLHRERADLLRSYEVRGSHMRILTRLVEYCREIAASKHLEQVLEHTGLVAADVSRSSRISIMLPDGEGGRLRIARAWGMDEDLAATVKVPVGEPIAGQVFATGRPIVINSVEDGEGKRPEYDSHFFASVPLISTPLGTSESAVGVLNITQRDGARPYEAQELEYVELISKIAATAIHDILTREARDQASDSIMVALAKLAEHRDNDTGLHLDRVTRYCQLLAEHLRKQDEFQQQITDSFLYNLARAVPLHDIGKVAIPDHILLHPGKLDEQQMAIMRTHASIGARTMESLIENAPGVDFLEMAADITHYHHEWHDGSGYPLGLSGQSIPLSARITALADVYDALTTKRVYKSAISHDRTVAIIVESSGTQFDPAVVDAFIELETEFAQLAQSMADDPPEVQSPQPVSAPTTA
ncbi:MAG: response regulator [bacterium]|nr:response regulator [bacterium]